MELALKYRPSLFKHLAGQEKAVEIIKGWLDKEEVPRQLLFSGPSGVGKTTAARILKRKLKCSDADYDEINVATERGIGRIRDIETYCQMMPWKGEVKIYLLDECHQLLRGSQHAFLKVLEEPPEHVYFILCTTDPNKLIDTIRTRCHEVSFSFVSQDGIIGILNRVVKEEDFDASKKLIKHIAIAADGSARSALNMLESAMALKGESKRLNAVSKQSTKLQVIDLCRAVMKGGNQAQWKNVVEIYKSIDDEPETIRRAILGYAAAVLLSHANERAYWILTAFEDNLYDTGKAGLVRALYEVFTGK